MISVTVNRGGCAGFRDPARARERERERGGHVGVIGERICPGRDRPATWERLHERVHSSSEFQRGGSDGTPHGAAASSKLGSNTRFPVAFSLGTCCYA